MNLTPGSTNDQFRPALDEFRELARGPANLIPVTREFAADLETPVSVYLKLMDEPGASFLLESVEGGEQVGRYSFVGVNPRATISLRGRTVERSGGAVERGSNPAPGHPFSSASFELADGRDILHELKDELARYKAADLPGLPRFAGGAVGYLGYDVVRFFEKLPETAAPAGGGGVETHPYDVPDAIFLLTDTLIVFDHARHRLILLANASLAAFDGDVEAAYVDALRRIDHLAEKLLRPLPAVPTRRWGATHGNGQDIEANMSRERYETIVRQAKEYIAAGDIFQVVLSQRFGRRTSAHPFAVYRALRMLNPSPYMFYFNFAPLDLQVIGASPEMHVRLEDGVAAVRPIAGTRRRGASPAEDAALATELLADPKERAEHVMLVDLGRNDVGRVSEYGSVAVRDLMTVERYSHVMHIVSHVEGRIRPGLDAYDLMRATFPAGTVSGAPKVRAMAIIEELEGQRRGLYAGAVGYFSYDGSMDTCIAIRTMVMQGDRVSVQAGAGIVADSDPATEYQECVNKAGALLVAVERAEAGTL
ncbi:MAG: anthranilate synthase component I [Anaerolineae bacterium]|uniref:anthranilate synthase component I n=1 Tax=Promineifilum sp. TaxID=2664178 RepID=UPI001D5960A5|nr:anthranilate synthase component I [Anaerolineales bacterium]MCB8935351.1 anthranilate synthase component I [Promineifilum sp.]MCO5182121.1 anthranilate synthase component I [Promineifilum sp.]MCW5846542.1 anthranilate synthase component I [Anaerolineae bacterium]